MNDSLPHTNSPGQSGRMLRDNLITTFVYLLIAKSSLFLALPGTNASPVWPPSGIALAFFLMYGYRISPGIAAGAFIANVWTMLSGDLSNGYLLPVLVGVATAIGNTFEAVAGYWLLKRYVILSSLFTRVRGVVWFTVIAFIISLTGAVTGPTAYCMAGLAKWDIYPDFFLTWWLGDATGIIIFAPLAYTLLSFTTDKLDPGKVVETALISIGLAILSLIVFRNDPNHILSLLIPYIFFPLIIWIAQKFNSMAAIISMAIVSIIAVDGTVYGYGPFVKSSLNTSLLLLQGFVSILAFTSLSFSASTNEKKYHEDKAIKSANDLKAVFRVLPDLYFKFSREGIILDCYTTNPTFHLENPENLKNRPVSALFSEEILATIRSWIFNADEKQQIKEFEFISKVTGQDVNLEARLFYMVESDEFIAIIRDISEKVKTRDEITKLNAELEARVIERTQELDYKNKELEAFSYSVSHDLRAPLRHISGFVDLLIRKEKVNLSEKGEHYLGAIALSARQMGDLIDDLLQFSRTGRAEMRSTFIDMNVIVKDVAESSTKGLTDRKIEWEIQELPEVFVDPPLIRQVWVNLLSNAVKFSKNVEQAIIKISTKEEDSEFIFSVQDNGAGFDMRYSQKLFGVFQRLHPKEEFDGTGIGLANVHRIISRHGGRVWAEAEPGKGATFFFTLPKKSKELK